jgi:hypothetical protein
LIVFAITSVDTEFRLTFCDMQKSVGDYRRTTIPGAYVIRAAEGTGGPSFTESVITYRGIVGLSNFDKSG